MTNIQSTKVLIMDLVKEALSIDGEEVKVSDDMPLFGSESALDSLRLVELCLALEDKASEEGYEFDWTSEAAMSKSRSSFRSISSLAEEYACQIEAQK